MTRTFLVTVDEEGKEDDGLEGALSECISFLNIDFNITETTDPEEEE